jgi:hypothetical protein
MLPIPALDHRRKTEGIQLPETEPVWICNYKWVKARLLVLDRLKVVEGPLKELASETGLWSMDITVVNDVLEIKPGK